MQALELHTIHSVPSKPGGLGNQLFVKRRCAYLPLLFDLRTEGEKAQERP